MVVKRYQRGRGYSKEAMVKLTLGELPAFMQAQIEHAKEHAPWRVKKNPDGTESLVVGTLDDELCSSEHVSREYLKSQGLPTAMRMYQWADGIWREKAPESPEQFIAGRYLVLHIEALGHERDSLPDLAARILHHCRFIRQYFKRGIFEQVATECVSLGYAQALWNVYSTVEKNAAKAVSSRHKNALSKQGFSSSEERKAQAVASYLGQRETYPYKKAKAIEVDVADMFGVKPGTIKNWVSESKKSNPTA